MPMTPSTRFFPFLMAALFSMAGPAIAEVFPRPTPTPYIVPDIKLADTGQIIQDHVGVFVPNTVDALGKRLEALTDTGQTVRLVVIQRHVDIGSINGLNRFADTLFAQWEMAQRRNSILVIHEAESNKVLLRLGAGFDQNTRQSAQNILETVYQPRLDQHRFSQAHHKGMLALLQALKDKSADADAAQDPLSNSTP
ncbi:MAG: TPM domain-containing protein, partial [Marinosulfonomonas sp.]|nr:TPM domain-containing protein [Marinosulfonomonas sp.]